MNKGKVILGVLAGIAAGAVMGVLLAPEKGSRTRKIIQRKGEDLADALNDKIDEKFDELVDRLTGRLKKTKTPGDAAVNKNEYVD
ncbi:MAG TPA: YtxH domain-containing protein [Ohtaekwangia sp.]|uniref:YtxH domain-containing protein n=1 Tax=Ohtaekwangia sp. TaxID=2066019 RepID=UPI002F955CF5